MASTVDEATVCGHNKLKTGDLDAAEEYFQRALEKAYEEGNQSVVKGCLFNVGACHVANGKARQGLMALNQAEELQELSEETEDKADLYYNIGLANFSLGQLDKAAEAYNNAVLLFDDIKNDEMKAEINAKLGVCYSNLDKPEDAICCFKIAVGVWENMNETRSLIISLNNLAKCLAANNKLEDCGNILRKLFNEFENIDDDFLLAQIFSDIGLIYSNENELESARDCFCEAYQRLKKGQKQNYEVEGTILQNLGAILNRQQNFKDAIKYHQLAMKAYELIDNKAACSRTASNAGYAYYMINDTSNAIINFEKAKEISHKYDDKEARLLALHGLAPLYCQNGNYENAIEIYGDIVALLSTKPEVQKDNIEDTIKKLINVTYMKAKQDISLSSNDFQVNNDGVTFKNPIRHKGNDQRILISRGLSINAGDYNVDNNQLDMNNDSVMNATNDSSSSSYYEKPIDEHLVKEHVVKVSTKNEQSHSTASKMCVIQ